MDNKTLISTKNKVLIIIFSLISSIVLANYYYEEILPYKVYENSFSLNNQTTAIEINYNDPDIPYRDMEITVKLDEGGPIEIIYVQCSDDAYLTLDEGSTSFTHNIAFFLQIRLIDTNGWANGSYSIIDRTSFLVPKTATEACTSIPKIVYFFNLTVIAILLSTITVAVYIIFFKREVIMQLLGKDF